MVCWALVFCVTARKNYNIYHKAGTREWYFCASNMTTLFVTQFSSSCFASRSAEMKRSENGDLCHAKSVLKLLHCTSYTATQVLPCSHTASNAEFLMCRVIFVSTLSKIKWKKKVSCQDVRCFPFGVVFGKAKQKDGT